MSKHENIFEVEENTGQLVDKLHGDFDALMRLHQIVREGTSGFVNINSLLIQMTPHLTPEQLFRVLDETIRLEPVLDHNVILKATQSLMDNFQDPSPDVLSLARFVVEQREQDAVSHVLQSLQRMRITDRSTLEEIIAIAEHGYDRMAGPYAMFARSAGYVVARLKEMLLEIA
ncbi:MAG: hypothetical protein COS89_01235 [Deltaproteobacteria bacterium CG07_land_8_20_14_0_80_38_7]|nr:MAG: hypothetical protein COS89_01235 [Deltaproteobacteria bacterium CG07_land_8_20_14_0_80_38_7]